MSVSSGAVLGRVTEVERLRSLLHAAVSGRGGAAVVEGEPGIGKTTLLNLVASEADASGVRVLRGTAGAAHQRLPFAAIGSCLSAAARSGDPDASPVVELLETPSVAAAGAADREFVVTEAILDLVDRWCTEGPVALILDDVQWADPSSLLVLGRMGRALDQLPLLLVCARRTIPRADELDALLRTLDARGALTLALGPMPGPAVAELVERMVGAPPDPRVVDLARRAGGNPLYVTELVDALLRSGRIVVVDGTATVVDETVLPESLVGAIGRRLDFLPGDAREALRVAAVLGPGLDITELSTVLGTPVIGLWEAVREAVRAGLLTESGEDLVFRHELIRQALAEELPAQVRGELQRRAGHALAEAGAPVDRVAEHLLAGDELDDAAVDWLVPAADQLLVRAPGMAVDLLDRALARPATMGEGETDRRDVLRLKLTRALLWAGRGADAQRAGRALLAEGRPTDAGLRWVLAHAAFQQGQVGEAIAEAERALDVDGLPPALAARFHGFVAQARLLRGEVDLAGDAAARALAAAGQVGDAYGLAYGLYITAGVRLMEQRHADGVDLAERALSALGTQRVQPDLQLAPQVIRGFCLLELDRLADADAAFEAGLRQRERAGRAFLTWHHMGRVRVRFLDGRWDDALAEIQAGLDVIDPLGMAPALHSQAALVAMHRGDFDTYADLVSQPDTGLAGQYWDFLRLSVRALAVEHDGYPDRALAELMAYVERGVQRLPYPIKLNYLYPEIARLAAQVGDAEPAARVRAFLDPLVVDEPAANLRAVAQLCRGVAGGDAAALLSAAQAYRQAGRALYEGYAYETAAAVLAGQGGLAQARAALESALQRYDELDAGFDASRAEARLRQAGIRRRAARRRPGTGWASLTDTERAIAFRVAQGRANADIAAELFLARRTVQSHVSRILAKLGLSSRIDLATFSGDRAGSPVHEE